MTEFEWCRTKVPNAMLEHLRHCGLNRKLRLFAVACCRPYLDIMADGRCQLAIDTSERFADGAESFERLAERSQEMQQPLWVARPQSEARFHAVAAAMWATVEANIVHGFWMPANNAAASIRKAGDGSDRAFQARLIRCIFGNPFRPVAFDPQWLTSTVTHLAHGIYDDRAFDRMPILADALQDAGCENDDILNHCRDPKGIHARGCWVVDLILGKE